MENITQDNIQDIHQIKKKEMNFGELALFVKKILIF